MSTFVQIRADGGTPISIAQQTSTDVANTPELLTTAGAGNWTKPAGVTKVLVECWGGGGAGAGANVADTGGGGGAGGQYTKKLITYASAQQSISYSVAASVAGTTGDGTAGNDTTWNTNVVVAKGGQGGFASVDFGGFVGGEPGIGSTVGGVGDVVYQGGDGTGGTFQTLESIVIGGGGGGGAGSTGNGSFPVGDPASSTTTQENGGAGGTGISYTPTTGGQNGNAGSNYGGGGSGAVVASGANRTGGTGAQGLIRITTYSTTTTTPPGVPAGGNK